MISELTLAMVARQKVGVLSSTIHPYPTQAEALRKAGDAYMRTKLTPTVKKLFEKCLAWRRIARSNLHRLLLHAHRGLARPEKH